MSNGTGNTTRGDVNHVVMPGHAGVSEQFSPAHCAITIVGDWGGGPQNSDDLIQYWWGVTPNKVFLPTGPAAHSIIWTLNVGGLTAQQGGVWSAAGWDDHNGGVNAIGGITMDPDSDWDSGWGVPTKRAGGHRGYYQLDIPAGANISPRRTFGYTVRWTVGGSRSHFDPELEGGSE